MVYSFGFYSISKKYFQKTVQGHLQTVITRGYFFEFSGTYAGGGGAKNCPKKYNIDYFGHAANLEVKFKLNFDEERG